MRRSTYTSNSGGRILGISVLVCLFVTSLGWSFWLRGQAILRGDLRDRLLSTASIAAAMVDPKDVAAFRSPEDMETAAFRRLVEALRHIRGSVRHIHFAYIMRRTNDPMLLEFVADADALGTPAELDLNANGIVDPEEEGSHPGELYDISQMPALQSDAFEHPTVDPAFTEDQWGILLSGYAPIRDANGKTIAVLGIDMNADEFVALSQRILSPFALLLLLLAGLGIASLIQWDAVKRRMAAAAFIEEERSGLLQLTLHRLGTPLTIFKWSLENLADCIQGKQCPAKDVEAHILQMRAGIRSMDEITKQMLEAERVEGGSLQNDPKPTPICPIIEEVIRESAADLATRKQHVSITACADETARVDPKILHGILRELIQNASVYSPKGATITVSSTKKGGNIVCSVADAGCGIPASERHRIFQKFGRASNAHLRYPNGAGLGLYITRTIVEHAGGRIWMESNENKGTTVTFTVPSV